MNGFVVKRRDTLVEPAGVEIGRRITKVLNIVFITWSVLTIIMYFLSIDIPDYFDVGVSIFAISVSVTYQLYKAYWFKKSQISKVFDDPDLALRRKIDNGDIKRKAARVEPINNLDMNFLSLEDIKADFR
jgi:hypothetical protein